jgi:hypothetical protein
MKKAFHMLWRTMANGVATDGAFVVHMTQEQWESPDKRSIVNDALDELGLTTRPFPPANKKRCVVSENKPKRSAAFQRAIVNAIQQTSAELACLHASCFNERYASVFDQKHRLTGSVTVSGCDFYFRHHSGAGLCDYAEKLPVEEEVEN